MEAVEPEPLPPPWLDRPPSGLERILANNEAPGLGLCTDPQVAFLPPVLLPSATEVKSPLGPPYMLDRDIRRWRAPFENLELMTAFASAAFTLYLFREFPELYLAFSALANMPSLFADLSFEEVIPTLRTAPSFIPCNCVLDPFLRSMDAMLPELSLAAGFAPKEMLSGAASSMLL